MKNAATATAILFFTSFAKAEVGVIQYEGPAVCEFEQSVQALHYVKVHYTGTIDHFSKTGEKGKVFDSTIDRGRTLDFQVGTGQGLPGLSSGLIGLCMGSKATITVPPEFGYGDKGFDDFDIPPGATLHFDVEVWDVQTEAPEESNLFSAMDSDVSGDLSRDEIEKYMELHVGRKSLPDGFWERQDTDGNGFISWEEFSGPKGDKPPPSAINAFQIIDTDKSGYLSRDELEAFALRVHEMSVPDHVWAREDKDGDGQISWEEFTGQKGSAPPGYQLP